ncbi:hypothetical protein [Acinetobacter shaoyimingii]|uniref:Lipoprotein n=1 Tax=Acinetobacter shaoyimingii TaxID=2715164 RepID=A0A6G8RYH5_9GAMM|nr:hypothetical protein [Acinetobacter shaoyimingii]QIO07002.1 hypothetical protein G8E00_14200 [Acinetobacter shaoyimingii]
MRNLISMSVLSLALLSGCATTEKLAHKVNFLSSDTPLAQVLKERPDLRKKLSTVEIRQYFNRVENPSVAQVKVTETGLMDDSVRSIRTVYSFKNFKDDWVLIETKKEYQCQRGSSKEFQTNLCS